MKITKSQIKKIIQEEIAKVREGNYPNSPLVMGMEKDYAMALSTVLGISPEEVDSMTPQQIGELGTSIRNHYLKQNRDAPPLSDPRRTGKYTPRES